MLCTRLIKFKDLLIGNMGFPFSIKRSLIKIQLITLFDVRNDGDDDDDNDDGDDEDDVLNHSLYKIFYILRKVFLTAIFMVKMFSGIISHMEKFIFN